MLYAAIIAVSSCKDPEADTPPKSSFTVDQTSGKADVTEFTFTVNQVDADAITLYPYGKAFASWGTVLIDPKDFVNGVATKKFKYTHVGEFQAIVVSNNHTSDGESVANKESDAKTITISSDKASMSAKDFKLAYKYKDGDKDVTINSLTTEVSGNDITVTMPYGDAKSKVDVKNLVATFTADPFSTVNVGATAQTSDKTANNFETPVTYKVVANDGTTGAASEYKVTVVVTPIEKWIGIKSFKGKLGTVKDRAVNAFTDSTAGVIVVYDVNGTKAEDFKEVKVAYELNGKFAALKYSPTGTGTFKPLAQEAKLDLSAGTKKVKVYSQDSASVDGIKDYTVYAIAAPAVLTLSFDDLNPIVVGTTKDFNIELKALTQGTKTYNTYYSLSTLPAGVTMSNFYVTDASGVRTNFSTGDAVDFSKPVTFEIEFTDANLGITYIISYKAILKQV